MKIKIRLEKWEKAVVMQVLEQEGIERRYCEIFNNGEMYIKLANDPELLPFTVYIRGNNSCSDFKICFLDFETNEERDEYYNRVVRLFKDFNNRYKKEESEEQNIFILE